jgi:hypothetical protein
MGGVLVKAVPLRFCKYEGLSANLIVDLGEGVTLIFDKKCLAKLGDATIDDYKRKAPVILPGKFDPDLISVTGDVITFGATL